MSQDPTIPFSKHDLDKGDPDAAVYTRNRYKRKRTSSSAKILQFVIFFVVLAGVVVGSYFLYLHFFKNQTNTKKNKYSPPPAVKSQSRFVFDQNTETSFARDGEIVKDVVVGQMAAQSTARDNSEQHVKGVVNEGYPYKEKPSEAASDVALWAYHEWAGKNGKLTAESAVTFAQEWAKLGNRTEPCNLPGYVYLHLLPAAPGAYLIYLKWLESGTLSDTDKEQLAGIADYLDPEVLGGVALASLGYSQAYEMVDLTKLDEDPDVKAMNWPELSSSFDGLQYPPIASSDSSESGSRLAFDWRDRSDAASRLDRHDHLVTHVKIEQQGSTNDASSTYGAADRTRDHHRDWHREGTQDRGSAYWDRRDGSDRRDVGHSSYSSGAADNSYSRQAWERQGNSHDYQQWQSHVVNDHSRDGFDRSADERGRDAVRYAHDGYSVSQQGHGVRDTAYGGRWEARGSHDAYSQQEQYPQQDGYGSSAYHHDTYGRDAYHRNQDNVHNEQGYMNRDVNRRDAQYGRDASRYNHDNVHNEQGYVTRDVDRQRDTQYGRDSRSQWDRYPSQDKYSQDTNRGYQQDAYGTAQQYSHDGYSQHAGHEQSWGQRGNADAERYSRNERYHGRRLAQRDILAAAAAEGNSTESTEFEPVKLRVVFHIMYYYCGGSAEGDHAHDSDSSDSNSTTSGKYSCPGLPSRPGYTKEAVAQLVKSANEYLANEFVYGSHISLEVAKIEDHNKQFHTLKNASDYLACGWNYPEDPIPALGLNLDPSTYLNIYVCGSFLAVSGDELYDRVRDRAGRADTYGVAARADGHSASGRADIHPTALHTMSAEAGKDQKTHITLPFDMLDTYGLNQVYPDIGNPGAKHLVTKIIHHFGVPPTFGFSEDAEASTCSGTGDGIADTTPEDVNLLNTYLSFQLLYKCTVGTEPTCGDDSWPAINGTCSAKPDNIYNHASYSPLYCHTHFTPGQVQAFQKSLVGNFKSLYACSKASADGSCFN